MGRKTKLLSKNVLTNDRNTSVCSASCATNTLTGFVVSTSFEDITIDNTSIWSRSGFALSRQMVKDVSSRCYHYQSAKHAQHKRRSMVHTTMLPHILDEHISNQTLRAEARTPKSKIRKSVVEKLGG